MNGNAKLGAKITDVETIQTADTFVFKGSVVAVSDTTIYDNVWTASEWTARSVRD